MGSSVEYDHIVVVLIPQQRSRITSFEIIQWEITKMYSFVASCKIAQKPCFPGFGYNEMRFHVVNDRALRR